MTAALLLALLAAGQAEASAAAPPAPSAPAPELRVEPLASPAPPGARWPTLHYGGGGAARLAWVEPREPEPAPDAPAPPERFALGHARLVEAAGAWSAPGRGPAGEGWFVNWADVPVVAARADDLAAVWLRRSGDAPYAYDALLSVSRTGGLSWSEPIRLHDDATPAEHGFVTLRPTARGWTAVWLDGRAMPEGGATRLYLRNVGPPGPGSAAPELGSEVLLDDRVCDCCPTDLVALPNGTWLVAYRDRSEDEVRDVYVVRLSRKVEEPVRVHADGWTIPGCPVNGPSLATDGTRVAVAWYTEADRRPRVQVALSRDGGRSFEAPILVDGDGPIGRVEAGFTADGSLLVGWLAAAEDGAAAWRVARVADGAVAGEPVDVAAVPAARSAGHLALLPYAADEDRFGALVAWTEPPAERDGTPSVRTALVRVVPAER